MFLPIVIWILIIAFIAGLVLSAQFRQAVAHHLGNIMTIVFGVTRIYAIVAGIVLLTMTILIVIAVLIGNPIVSGIVFSLSIVLFIIVWLPLGIVLRIFNGTPAVVPPIVRTVVAWIAVLGFFAVMTPEFITFKLLLVGFLVAVIFSAITSRFNILERVMAPLVIITCLLAAWHYVAPDSYRAAVRHRMAIGALATTANDRGAFRKETRASSTFAKLLTDVNVVYKLEGDSLIMDQKTYLSGTIFLLCNQKEECLVYQGQSFTEVRATNDQGTYVNGNCFWIESNLLEIGTLKDFKGTSEEVNKPELVVLSVGEKTFHLPNAGDETPWIKYQQCIKFHVMINSPDRGYELVFSDGRVFQSTDDLPYMENPVYKIRAVKPNQFVTVNVTERS